MQIVDDKVVLSPREQDTVDYIEFRVKTLRHKREAAIREALAQHKGRPSKDFVEWLSKGTLTITNGAITSHAA